MILNTKKKPLRVPSFFFLCGDFISVTDTLFAFFPLGCDGDLYVKELSLCLALTLQTLKTI